MSAQQNKLEVLLNWFNENKVEWDKEALEIRETDGSFGVYAKKNMKKDKPGKKKKKLLESFYYGIIRINSLI